MPSIGDMIVNPAVLQGLNRHDPANREVWNVVGRIFNRETWTIISRWWSSSARPIAGSTMWSQADRNMMPIASVSGVPS